MKTVVFVSYHFPPSGGKAVQRASKLVKYLPKFGWRPIVFTMPMGEPGVPVDRTLLDDLPADIEIHRPAYRNWWRLVPHDIRKHLYHPVPDKYRGWVDSVSDKLVDLVRASGADAIASTSPSHSTQLLGLAVKKRTGIPWIADFRDPWAGHPDFPSKRHAAIMRDMETEVLESADAVVGVYPKILRDFEDRIPKGKMHLIENGYDEDDFHLVDRTRKASEGALLMGYNGTVSGFHDPAPFLDPLEKLAADGCIDGDAVRIVFTTSESGKKRFASYRTLSEKGILIVNDYLPHAESLARLGEMDISLHLLTRGGDIYPGKIFEYFYLGNPILSISRPDDDLHRLIEETGTGMVVDYRDTEAVVTAVLDLIRRKKNGDLSHLVEPDGTVARFSRKNIAGRFAGVLDAITL